MNLKKILFILFILFYLFLMKINSLLLIVIYILYISQASAADFIIDEVKRTINLKQSIITIENEIKIKKISYEDTFHYLVPKNNTKSLIRITAQTNKGKRLQMTKVSDDQDYDHYDIILQGSEEIVVNEDYFEKLTFKPKNIYIKEDQLELFTDTINLVSKYSVKSTVTKVILPSEKTTLIKLTKSNMNQSGDKLIYSLTEEIPPLVGKKLYIHYLNNIPLMVFNYAVKTFQVSHWGNIAVTEEYQLENIGAKLIGEFGRIDYDDGIHGGKNAMKKIRAKLPLRAWGLWYRDEIGNVSTSVAKRQMNDVDLELTPRFPILGGWKSNYDIGYNLPTKFHVKTNNQGNYMVNLTFGMPYQNMLARNYTVKIILPESADNIKVKLPIDAPYQIEYDKEYGCLDLFGRKSIIIRLNNMYDVYNTNIFITYDYQWTMLFVKPVILIFYFLIIFIILIIYSRANISLARKDETELKEKIE
jgi:oligosaccharyltransferase complex subunit alpha (ribophorin I)